GEASPALLDEARALARVRHPSVVAVYGIGEWDGRAGMWMERLRGETLAARIERGALPPREVARIGAALCSALEALDQAGLVHRDLKPSNVVLESDDRAVLTDFGLGSRLTFLPSRSPRPSGTPLFMAPSLLEGGSPNPRTDLYALAVSLRWALTGRAPFEARTMDELKEQVRGGPAHPLSTERPDAPPALIAAIERGMDVCAGAPAYRARDMRMALEPLIAEERGAPPRSDHRAAPQETTRPSIAVLPFLNRGQDESDEYFSDGLADEMLNVLSKIHGLHVAARTSSFHFKGKNEELEVIGRRLNVATVLEGSVRKSGNRVRIAVRLVKVATGEALWSESYQRTLEDIFSMQDEIAQRVVEELRKALLPASAPGSDVQAEVAVAARGRGHDAEAHRLYLLGRHRMARKTLDDLTQGAALLEQAVARDPTHAIAWSELGNLYATLADLDHSRSSPTCRKATRGWRGSRPRTIASGAKRRPRSAARSTAIPATPSRCMARASWPRDSVAARRPFS
ncbi:MAG: hypothetical protein E6K80_09575, partial [Candidatus Eisenbacteria bacterium]